MRTLVVGNEGMLLEPLVDELAPSCSELCVLGKHGFGRASPLGGSPAGLDFALPGKDYLELAHRIERVVVAATPERGRIRQPNEAEQVKIAQEVLEFVRAGGGRSQVVFLSSLLVFGTASTRVGEGDFRVGQSFGNPLEESLALAERIIRSVRSLDVPLVVLRVAPLIGDRTKRTVDRSSPWPEVLDLVRSSGIRPDTPWTERPVHFETYDHAAHALARLACAGGTRTAHCVRPAPPTDRQLWEWLEEKTGPGRGAPERLGSLIRRPPLLGLRSPEKRAFAGSDLIFGHAEAQALGLLDPASWTEVLAELLSVEDRPSPVRET